MRETPASVLKVHEEADGMAASTKSVADRYEHLLKSGEHEVPAMQVDSSLHFDDTLCTLLLNKRCSADSIFHV